MLRAELSGNLGDQRSRVTRNIFQECPVLPGEGIHRVRVNIDLANVSSPMKHRNNNFRSCLKTAGEIVRLPGDILHQNHRFALGTPPAESTPVGYTQVFSGLTLKRSEHQHSLSRNRNVKPYPVVGRELVTKEPADLSECGTALARTE